MKIATIIKIKTNLKIFLDIILLLIGILSLVTFILIIGFHLTHLEELLLRYIIKIIIYAFVVEEIIRLFTLQKFAQHLKERWVELFIALVLLFEIIFETRLQIGIKYFFPFLTFDQIALLYLIISQLIIFLSGFFKLVRHSSKFTQLKVPPGAILATSFALLILIGSFFLSLPKSSATGVPIKYIDALFTSTSAVCVTGLIVLDTAKDFSLTGQIIILCLIQLGGLGIMTLTTFFFSFIGGGLTIKMRLMLKEFLSPDTFSIIGTLLKRIIFFTFIIETIGFALLYISTLQSIPDNGFRFFNAFFHSVSAFCNAGFSLFSENLMAPVLKNNYLFKFTVSFLIILGGLGFITLSEIFSLKLIGKKVQRIKYQLSPTTKLVLTTTFILIFGGAIVILGGEYNTNILGESLFERIFNSYFQSVTARTAGFNTVPIEQLTVFTALVLIFLMWVGASPGGTGGGIKTTTFSVAFLFLFNYIRGRERLVIYNRDVDHETIQKSLAIILLSLLVLFIGTAFLVIFETDKNPINLLFETVSAFGTVGLSRNTTFHIGDGSKFVLVWVMFIGRVGVLTFFTSFFKPFREYNYILPKTHINVG
ncbi:MAG: TrkH family potassium uptake protein [Candidatus Kapaibacteriota bacterium]